MQLYAGLLLLQENKRLGYVGHLTEKRKVGSSRASLGEKAAAASKFIIHVALGRRKMHPSSK